jgi:hypothetical protein
VGSAAGGDDQDVVRGGAAVVGKHQFGEAVDFLYPDAGMECDVVVPVPGQGVEEDVARVLLSRENMAEHDPVVVAVGFVAEHGDPVLRRAAAGQDLLDGARPGHAIADHHEPAARINGFGPEGPAGQRRHQCSTMPRSTTR